MDELREMIQILVGAMHAQQQLLQQHFQHLQQQPVNQHSSEGENHRQMEMEENQKDVANQEVPVANIDLVKQFLKLKPPTFNGGMNPVKANEWLTEIEKNFRLLRCDEVQKVENGSYLLIGEVDRQWNLKECQVAEFERLKQIGEMTIAKYEAAFTNLAECAPHLVATDEMRAQLFEEGLRYEIKRVVRPMVLPTYAEILDRAIIVEQDEEDRKSHCFNCKEVGHLKKDCLKLKTGANAVPVMGYGGRNAMPGGNENRPSNSEQEWQWE
ncbi:hypothetical protein Acr_04g0002380 [Actinidia rufa]|uniref:CCHC-type domain-containing protein n=1 Tax=Actinidia rufa TaxID=165716 RepID=A0A7J0EGJ4_9ERIC|nr:hypothetical protein Acr_04g0002380 [Actinidia rufa]